MNKKESLGNRTFAVLQKVGRSFMFPIALLPIAGFLLGIGSSFTNESVLELYNLTSIMGPETIIFKVLTLFTQVGSIIFDNLSLIFAMGVALGMAKQEKAVATLSAAVAFLTMHQMIHGLLDISGRLEEGSELLESTTTSVCGIQSLNMGVFGGIVIGLIVAALHNKFYKIELPAAISFFGGIRFIPIISVVVSMLVGTTLYFVWPMIQVGILALGQAINSAGVFGSFFYGYIFRALIPFGLHHVFYMPFWQTSLGGEMLIDGTVVQGAQNIFFAQLADPSTTSYSVEAAKYMSGEFAILMFGLTGAALAMYRCANPDRKKAVAGLYLSAALTCFFVGVSEPLEFSFLFVAPGLYYGFNCVMAGLSYALIKVFGIAVGTTFSGGLIDLTLFGILQGNSKTHWFYIVLIGIVYFILYYLVFTFCIKKFNIMTPGREINNEQMSKLYTREDLDKKTGINTQVGRNIASESQETTKTSSKDDLSEIITKALGGKDNIEDVDCCATRLRLSVKDEETVDTDTLKQTGAVGVIKRGKAIQVIYGPNVTLIKSNLEEYLQEIN